MNVRLNYSNNKLCLKGKNYLKKENIILILNYRLNLLIFSRIILLHKQ